MIKISATVPAVWMLLLCIPFLSAYTSVPNRISGNAAGGGGLEVIISCDCETASGCALKETAASGNASVGCSHDNCVLHVLSIQAGDTTVNNLVDGSFSVSQLHAFQRFMRDDHAGKDYTLQQVHITTAGDRRIEVYSFTFTDGTEGSVMYAEEIVR